MDNEVVYRRYQIKILHIFYIDCILGNKLFQILINEIKTSSIFYQEEKYKFPGKLLSEKEIIIRILYFLKLPRRKIQVSFLLSNSIIYYHEVFWFLRRNYLSCFFASFLVTIPFRIIHYYYPDYLLFYELFTEFFELFILCIFLPYSI